MRIYAEQRGRAARQLLADVLVLIWVVLVVEIARAAFRLIARLQGPGQGLKGAGEAIQDAFLNAAQRAAKSVSHLDHGRFSPMITGRGGRVVASAGARRVVGASRTVDPAGEDAPPGWWDVSS